MSYEPKGDADAFMRRVGEKYPWLHPHYDEKDGTWQMRAVKARDLIKREAAQPGPSK